MQRSFDHHLAGTGGQGRLQKRRLVRTGPFHQLQQLKFLFDLSPFPSQRKHGIEQHHIRRLQKPLQKRYTVSRTTLHAGADISQGRLRFCPAQAIFQQCGDYGVVLEEQHLKTRGSQQQGVFAKSCGGIHGANGCFPPANPGCPQQELALEELRPQPGHKPVEIGPQHVPGGHIAPSQGQPVCIPEENGPWACRPFSDKRQGKPLRQRFRLP